MALTFAYELGLERFLYIKIDRFDETKTIHVDHVSVRGSLGGVMCRIVFLIQNLSISNTTLAFEMRSDGDGANFKDVHIDNTELFYVDHFSI